MFIKFYKITTLFLVFSGIALGQYLNNIWCFGDSAGIDVSIPNNPVLFSSVMDSRGTCCSIADSTGLLFYAHVCNNFWITSIRGVVKNNCIK